MAEIQKTRYAIEVVTSKNGRLKFMPLARTVRGRWSATNIIGLDPNEDFKRIASIGEIPGEIIWIDLEKREAGTADQLALPANKGLWKTLVDFNKRVNKKDIEFKAPSVSMDMDHNQIKDFLYWMARAVKAGHAQTVPGTPELPSLEDIKKMPGKRQLNHGYETWDQETLDRQKRFEYDVPVRAANPVKQN